MRSDEQTEQAYIPGVFRCAKCGFRLHQMKLNANSGAVTARDAPGEKCPNDGSPMWRVTYSEQLAEAHEEWGKQVERAAEAERKLDAIRDALEPVRHWYDGEPADGEDHKPRLCRRCARGAAVDRGEPSTGKDTVRMKQRMH